MKKQPVQTKYVEFNTKYFTEYGRTVSKAYDFIFAVDILITDCFALGGPKKLQAYTKLMDTAPTQDLLAKAFIELVKVVPVSQKLEKMIMGSVNKQEELEVEFMIKPKWRVVKTKEDNTKFLTKNIETLVKLGEKFELAEDAVADLLEAIEALPKK